jgi:hypothetical protein
MRLEQASNPKMRAKLVQLLQHAGRGLQANPTATPEDVMVRAHVPVCLSGCASVKAIGLRPPLDAPVCLSVCIFPEILCHQRDWSPGKGVCLFVCLSVCPSIHLFPAVHSRLPICTTSTRCSFTRYWRMDWQQRKPFGSWHAALLKLRCPTHQVTPQSYGP